MPSNFESEGLDFPIITWEFHVWYKKIFVSFICYLSEDFIAPDTLIIILILFLEY